MGTPDLTLRPGDILRGRVVSVDGDLDACFLDAGAYGVLELPLAGLPDAAVARLVPGAAACAQVISPKHGQSPARATASIEFAGRTSVLVLDGTAVMGGLSPAAASVFVSKKLSGVSRAELATRLEGALVDQSCGLPAMLDAVSGPVTIILRSAAERADWDQVLSSIVVQATEAAAFTALASMDESPALLMAETPDADGDASLASSMASAFNASGSILAGRRVKLARGGEVVFERTAGLWCSSVLRDARTASDPEFDEVAWAAEAAETVAESVVEFEVVGTLAVAFAGGVRVDAFQGALDALRDALDARGSRISGDADLSIALISL